MRLATTQLTFQVKIIIEVNSVANPLNLNPDCTSNPLHLNPDSTSNPLHLNPDSTSNPPRYVEGPVECPH